MFNTIPLPSFTSNIEEKTAGDFYRIEFRIQNSVQKYYLIREIFSDAKKFSASRLITSGTPPTRTEVNRCASLYGFELELKCIAKAAKYRAEAKMRDTGHDALETGS